MRVLAKFVLAFGFVLALSLQAQAGPLFLSTVNPTPGSQTAQNDASVSQVFTSAGAPLGPTDVIAPGDIVVGVLRITNGITPPSPTFTSTQQLNVLFSAQILTQVKTTVGPNDVYTQTFGVTPAASGLSIDTLLSSPAGSKFAAGTFDKATTIGAVLENGNDVNQTTFGPLATVVTNLAKNYTLDESFGIVNTGAGGTNAAGSMDIFNATLNVPTGIPLNGANLIAAGATSPIGQDIGLFSHILNPTGLANFKPVTLTDSLVTGKKFSSDFGFSAQLVVPTDQQVGFGFTVGDHTTITFNAVATPEPSTCTLLLLGSVGFGFIARRRRNRQVAA